MPIIEVKVSSSYGPSDFVFALSDGLPKGSD